jgi:hypothetical protein
MRLSGFSSDAVRKDAAGKCRSQLSHTIAGFAFPDGFASVYYAAAVVVA